jgi:intracellular multiplication protein IcmD
MAEQERKMVNKRFSWMHLSLAVVCLSLMTIADVAVAQGDNLSLGTMASSIVSSFTNLAKLITATSYLAGLAFAIGAILKFKQHKENPSNITIGVPIALVIVAAALLFLPTILNMTGYTMFGSPGQVAGPTGVLPGVGAGGGGT